MPDIESRVSEQRTASCTSAAERRIRKNIFWGRCVAVKNKAEELSQKHTGFNDKCKFEN